MNAITQFRKTTLSDEDLIKKVDALCDQMYQTGRIPDRQIPARPDEDFDILVGELLLRFKERLWNKSDEAIPNAGERIILKFDDGRMVGATVTETLGVDIDHVDSIDLLFKGMSGKYEWRKI